MSSNYWQGKVALVTGGSAGLGLAVARRLAERGAKLVIAARSPDTLGEAARMLNNSGVEVLTVPADITRPEDVARLFGDARERFGTLDLLVNCAGQSARGTILDTPPAEFERLWNLNFLATLRCCQAAIPRLVETRGHIVNVGSLASKLAARYLSAYPSSKFPVAALSQQLRLELADSGIHVLLVCPGPIARADASSRYADHTAGLPTAAQRPGGGVRLRAIDPEWLANRILAACERRRPELTVPRSARLLFALSQLSPRLGDWLIRRMTK